MPFGAFCIFKYNLYTLTLIGGFFMININKFNKEMMNYFNTLPKYVQENIMQGNDNITTYQDLVSCTENMMKRK